MKTARIELDYRAMDNSSPEVVLKDIINTSANLCTWGNYNPEEYQELVKGIGKIRDFIRGQRYRLDFAMADAAKTAYVATLILHGIKEIKRFNPDDIESLRSAEIVMPMNTKLNKLKKSSLEAFYYWNEIQAIENKTNPYPSLNFS